MSRKNEQELLDDLSTRIEQLKAKKQLLQSRLQTKERKARTRRLIQIGAIFEKNFSIQSIEEAEIVADRFREEIKNFLVMKDEKGLGDV